MPLLVEKLNYSCSWESNQSHRKKSCQSTGQINPLGLVLFMLFNLIWLFLLFLDRPCWSKWYVIKIISKKQKIWCVITGKAKVELIVSSIGVTSKPTMSQHEQNPRTGTGKLKWNAASANVINYTCASSDMACQNVCYEAGAFRWPPALLRQ